LTPQRILKLAHRGLNLVSKITIFPVEFRQSSLTQRAFNSLGEI